jgi:hypothetical protein
MSEVAGVEHEGWGCGQSVDFCHRHLQGRDDIRIRRLVESDMAVADLDKTQLTLQGIGVVTVQVAEREGFQYPAFEYTKGSGTSPSHAFEKASPVNAVVVVIVDDVVGHGLSASLTSCLRVHLGFQISDMK